MSSEIKADKWSPASGTAGTIGDSGDTFTVPSGVTLDIASGATLDTTGATVTGATGSLIKISGGSASSAANHDFQSFMDTSKYNAYQISFSKVIGLSSNTFDLPVPISIK